MPESQRNKTEHIEMQMKGFTASHSLSVIDVLQVFVWLMYEGIIATNMTDVHESIHAIIM